MSGAIGRGRLGGGAFLGKAAKGFLAFIGIRPSEHTPEPPPQATGDEPYEKEYLGRLFRRTRGGRSMKHRDARRRMSHESRRINMRSRRGLAR